MANSMSPNLKKQHEIPGVFLSVTVREEAKHTPGVADLGQELHRENHGHFHQTKIESKIVGLWLVKT